MRWHIKQAIKQIVILAILIWIEQSISVTAYWTRVIESPTHHKDNADGDVIIPLYFNALLPEGDLALNNYPTMLAGIDDNGNQVFDGTKTYTCGMRLIEYAL